MDKQSILKTAKSEIQMVVEGMNLENISESKSKLEHYLSFIEHLSYLNDDQKLNDKERSQRENPVSETFKQLTEEQPELSPSYFFHRKLRGGFLEEIATVVPEGIVRQLGIEHGDYISVDFKGKHVNNGKPKIEFKIIEKRNEIVEIDRQEYKCCILNSRDGMLLAEKTGNSTIRFNEAPYSIVIRDTDIEEFGLKGGDVVDIACKKTDPSYNRVTYKHHLHTALPQTIERRKSHSYKIKNPQESVTDDTNNSLRGLTIFVVGGMSQKDNYKKVIENNGGVFMWLDGKEKKTRIRSRVKKADIVLWISEEMSHQGMYPTKEFCKDFGVRFKAMEGKGASSLLREAKGLISNPN